MAQAVRKAEVEKLHLKIQKIMQRIKAEQREKEGEWERRVVKGERGWVGRRRVSGRGGWLKWEEVGWGEEV